MSDTEKTRVWHYTMPSTASLPWNFSFRITFEWIRPQRVVVNWIEDTIGSGAFWISDCGITWKTLLITENKLHKLAYEHSMDWNELDARVQEKERGKK